MNPKNNMTILLQQITLTLLHIYTLLQIPEKQLIKLKNLKM